MRALLAALLLLSPTLALAGSGVGYGHATSQLKLDTRPTLYQPLNVLDGREISVWCEGAEGDGVGEGIHVGFKETTVIDEIRISTGDGKEDSTFAAHNRVKKLVVRERDSNHSFTMLDQRGPQSFKIDPPIEADRVFLEIAEVVRGGGEDNATCLSDVVFVSKGKALNGPHLTDRLKYDKGRAQLMNTWYAGPAGAPERFLEFYFDGTFHFVYRPFDPDEKGVTLEGDYTFEKGKLMLRLPAKGWVDAKATKQAIAGADGATRVVLEIANDALKDVMLQAKFSDQQ